MAVPCCATESISGPVGYTGCEFLAHAVGLLVLDRISIGPIGIKMSRFEWTIQWVDLRENLQETMDFPMNHGIFL